MGKRLQFAVVVTLCAAMLVAGTSFAFAASGQATSSAKTASKSTPGLEAARTISLVTGVAISPLLGVGAVGAYKYWSAPGNERAGLPWFAQPWFWVPALLLVAFVAAKDIVGTAAPTALKKPFDVAETIENKVSALIAAGAFIPLVISIFPSAPGADGASWIGLGDLGFATINGAAIGNALLVPFAIAAFAIVWLASHAINILILISPFTTVDTALKSSRLFLLSLVTGVSFANPYMGACFCALIILGSYFIAGWSFRMTVFGSVYLWDLLTARRLRFQPGAERNWMFTGRTMEKVPVRTYGRLLRANSGKLVFEYRPWLFLARRSFELPEGKYFVGRGLFYSEIDRREEERTSVIFILPPRFQTHEESLARVYSLEPVCDVGLLKGFKAGWNWVKGFFGVRQLEEPALPSAAPAALS
jgi:hypothetical protein